MPEEKTVRHILSECNPKLASGLRGIVSTVDQVVKMGSLIEKDWSNSKELSSRIYQGNPTDSFSKKPPRKPEYGQGRGHGADIAAVLGVPSLFVVPVIIRGSKDDAVLYSGCTYSMMSSTLWNNIKKAGETLSLSEIPRFIMASGQECKAKGKTTLLLTL